MQWREGQLQDYAAVMQRLYDHRRDALGAPASQGASDDGPGGGAHARRDDQMRGNAAQPAPSPGRRAPAGGASPTAAGHDGGDATPTPAPSSRAGPVSSRRFPSADLPGAFSTEHAQLKADFTEDCYTTS